MALKTNYKDALWDGDRLYQVTDAGSGKSAIKDVTVYTQIGDSFGAKDINDTNTEVNKLSEDMVSLKKSVSDGKTLVAAAITAKKVVTAATASFAEMAENIKKIVLGSGTARAADVLAGKTFTNNDGVEYTGSMPERGTWNGSLGTSGAVTIPSGHHSGSGKVSAQTQAAMTLNPGTTQKTAYVYQKYMLGNITVPAINIPAAYIKKGQKITFPDGSSVVGTFEGWVPVATDLYYNGQNVAGFKAGNAATVDYVSFDNNQITVNYGTRMILESTKTYDVRSYSRMIIEGNLILSSSGTEVSVDSKDGQEIMAVSYSGTHSSITIDISRLSTLTSGWTLIFGRATSNGILKGSYIRRIRLA